MRKRIRGLYERGLPCGALILAAAWFVATTVTAHAAGLNPKLLPTVKAATFEVVAAKTKDTATYARKLPLNLIPYQKRTDKYHSIGTAFALGHNRYITASHVLLSGLNSLWGPPSLRDSSGRVYAIDKILKYSRSKDFVEFSLKNPPGHAALKPDTHPAINKTVYAVGNALGTGIVIRNGLYTSNTPEQQDGRWKWIRFSAAASPGNSGGPLLNSQGQVIGVVLAKSPNENLNYALPISEVLNAPDDKAVIDKLIPYGFPVFDTTLDNTFKAQFALPESLSGFFASYGKHMHAYEDAQLKAILAKDPDRMFPHGSGSSKILHGAGDQLRRVPLLIKRNADGTWLPFGKKIGQTQLADNGRIRFIGASKKPEIVLFHMRKPDSVSVQKLYTHPQMLMDLLLKSGFLKRPVGSEKIKVTSLGKPTLDAAHADAWQRRWKIYKWPVSASNHYFYVAALPVPDGYVGIMLSGVASQEHDYVTNLKALTDFMQVDYIGTLKQWKAFLKQTDLLPAALQHTRINFVYGHRFVYASPLMHLAITPKLQKVQPDSVLALGFSFFPDHGKVIWGVRRLVMLAKENDKDLVDVMRLNAPVPGLGDKYRNLWNKLLHRHHPYDGIAYNDNDLMIAIGVVGRPAKTKPAVLRSVKYQIEGAHPQKFMHAKLERLLQDLHVSEH